MTRAPVKPTFFRTPAALRRWFEKHHDRRAEVWIGFYKKASGKGGITYHEALDEALCFGWIDGVRKRFDEEVFLQRFTPRRPKSYWSAVNIHRVAELQKAGRMHEAGLAVFERRSKDMPNRYSFERPPASLRCRSGGEVPPEREGVGVLRGRGTLVQTRRAALGHQRQEGGHAPATSGHADQGLRCRSSHRRRSPEFLEVAPSTPNTAAQRPRGGAFRAKQPWHPSCF
jgi:hypothetical protein